MERAIRERPWAAACLVCPLVQEGSVTCHGCRRARDSPHAVRVLAEGLPGVNGAEVEMREPPGFRLGAA